MGESREIQSDPETALVKLCQSTPIALLRMQVAPRDKFKLSAFERLYGRPIPQAPEEGHVNLLEMEQLNCVLQVGETTEALRKYGNHMLPPPSDWLSTHCRPRNRCA